MTATIKTFQSGIGDCIFFLIEDDATRKNVMIDCGKYTDDIQKYVEVMFQFVCPKRDPHFKELSKLHVLFHTMNNTNHIFIN